jgi:TPP-dependent pyruvate/acetoin dehydrogenase alpha subunit
MKATITEFATANKGFSLISNEKLLALYTAMVSCRKKSERALRGNGTRRPRGAEPVLGHEAAIVGTTIDLGSLDTIAPSLWPEGVLKAINRLPMRAASVLTASRNTLDATGRNGIAVLFSSDRRTLQAAWVKALSLASEKQLPILFVTLSHLDGSSKFVEKYGGASSNTSIVLKQNDLAVPVFTVDADDVVAVYRVATEAVTHARKGHGPTLIDCQSVTSSDCLDNMHKYLTRKGLNPGKIALIDSFPRPLKDPLVQ